MKKLLFSFPLLAIALVLLASCSSTATSRELRQAEEFARKGDYLQAIESYARHVELRLDLKNRPEWENPYFYYLLIGDLYLAMDDLDNARQSYEYAESKDVHNSLIADRYRFLASWYEQRGDYRTSLEILAEYRDRDPLLFDVIKDRIARQAIYEEDREWEAGSAEKSGEEMER